MSAHHEDHLTPSAAAQAPTVPVPVVSLRRIAGLAMRWNKGNSKQISRDLREIMTPQILAHLLRLGGGSVPLL